MNKYRVILGVWVIIAWGCDPCNDCGEPLVYDPTVNVVFINQDSINQLSSIVAINTESLTELNALEDDLSDSIGNLTIALDTLQDGIDEGITAYQSLYERYDFIQDSLEEVQTTIIEQVTALSAANTELNSIISTMANGNLQLKKVVLLNTNSELIYEDSMSTFALPLLLGTVGEYATSNYEITIVDTVLNLDFNYETFETINEARVARIRARDLTVLDNDTVHVNCTTSECISDETTVTVYF